MAAAIRLVIHGRVQGVGFRAFVVREARKLGLRGWVRNRHNGTVEALLIGAAEALAAGEAACCRGPMLAHVSDVERHAAADDGGVGFEERATE
jgi:acylphosphatase